MTREEALQEAVRAMRHERNCLRKLDEAEQAFGVVYADYVAARNVADAALSVLDDRPAAPSLDGKFEDIPAFLSGEKK